MGMNGLTSARADGAKRREEELKKRRGSARRYADKEER